MRVELDPHATARLAVRGASEEEAIRTVIAGVREPANHGRTLFVLDIDAPTTWRGQLWRGRRIRCYAAPIEDGWRVITVIVQFLRV